MSSKADRRRPYLIASNAAAAAATARIKVAFCAVVIDYELKNDIAASAFRQRFTTLNLNEDTAPEAVVMELTGLFRCGSELVQ